MRGLTRFIHLKGLSKGVKSPFSFLTVIFILTSLTYRSIIFRIKYAVFKVVNSRVSWSIIWGGGGLSGFLKVKMVV